jgi:hypothetical protein
MAQATPFSSLAERWREIRDFPRYSVSDHGKVMNTDTGRLLKPTYTGRGMLMVGLMRNKLQHKRSLPLLVAQYFVPIERNQGDHFNVPIQLDGDRDNVHFENLMWRPDWFARKYSRQFPAVITKYHVPIEDLETLEQYKHTWDAAMRCGLLEQEIHLAMENNTYVWPTGQIFREVGEPYGKYLP